MVAERRRPIVGRRKRGFCQLACSRQITPTRLYHRQRSGEQVLVQRKQSYDAGSTSTLGPFGVITQDFVVDVGDAVLGCESSEFKKRPREDSWMFFLKGQRDPQLGQRARNVSLPLPATGDLTVHLGAPHRLWVIPKVGRQKVHRSIDEAGPLEVPGLDPQVLRSAFTASRSAQTGPKRLLILGRPRRPTEPIISSHDFESARRTISCLAAGWLDLPRPRSESCRHARRPSPGRIGRAVPVRSATVVVTYAGCPTAASRAASNMSTTGGGQLAAVSRRNSSGESSWNARRRPSTSPMTATCRA